MRLKKILTYFATSAMTFLLALLIIPYFLDWSFLQQKITQRIVENLGGDIHINGGIKVRILPEPSIDIEKMSMANIYETNSKIESPFVQITLNMKSLISGNFSIATLILKQPSIQTEKDDIRSFVKHFNIRSSHLGEKQSHDLAIILRDANIHSTQQQAQIKHINGRINMYVNPSRLNADINLEYNQNPVNLMIETNGLTDKNTMPFIAKIGNNDAQNIMNIIGEWSFDDKDIQKSIFSGRLNLQDLDLSHYLASGGTSLPLSADANFIVKGDGIKLDITQLSLANSSLSGALEYDFSERKFNFMAQLKDELSRPLILDDNLENFLRRAVSYSPVSGMTGKISLKGLAVELNGKNIQNIDVNVVLENKKIIFDRISFSFDDGDAVLSSNYILSKDGNIFNSKFSVSFDNLRNMLNNTEYAYLFKDLPPEKMRRAMVTGEMSIRDHALELKDMNIMLDGQEAKLNFATANWKSLSDIQLRLRSDKIDLTSYTSIIQDIMHKSLQDLSATQQIEMAPLQKFKQFLRILDSQSLNADILIDDFVWNAQQMKDFSLVFGLHDGDLKISQVAWESENGLALDAKGRIANLRALSGIDIKANFTAANLGHFLDMERSRAVGLSSAQVTISGDRDVMIAGVSANIAGAQISLQGEGKNIFVNPMVSGKFVIQSPDASRLMNSFYPGSSVEKNSGPANLEARFLLEGNQFGLQDIKGDIGTIRGIKGKISSVKSDDRRLIVADIALQDAVLLQKNQQSTSTKIPKWSTQTFDIGFLKNIDARFAMQAGKIGRGTTILNDFALSASLNEMVLSLERFGGKIGAGQIGVTGNLSLRPTDQKIIVDADIKTTHLNPQTLWRSFPAAGSFDMNAKIATQGVTMAEMLKNLNGGGRINAQRVSLYGVSLDNLTQKISARQRTSSKRVFVGALSSGKTAFDSLESDIELRNGLVRTYNTKALSPKLTMNLAGTVNLNNFSQNLAIGFQFPKIASAPGFGLQLGGTIDAPTKNYDIDAILNYITMSDGKALQ